MNTYLILVCLFAGLLSDGNTFTTNQVFIPPTDSELQSSPSSAVQSSPSSAVEASTISTSTYIISTGETYRSTVKHSNPIRCKACRFAQNLANYDKTDIPTKEDRIKVNPMGCLYGIVKGNGDSSTFFLDCFDYNKCLELHAIAADSGTVNYSGKDFTTFNCCNTDLCNIATTAIVG